MKRISFLFAIVALFGIAPTVAPAAADGGEVREIRWILTGVDTDEGGTIRCALYRNDSTWLDRSRRFRRSSARVTRRQAACVFRNVPAGTYAMAALHDADGDRQMDKSALGLPREGYAISRDEHDAMSAPDFDDAAIEYDGGRLVTRSTMRY